MRPASAGRCRVARLAAVAAFSALAGCAAEPNAPTLTASFDSSYFDTVALGWIPPTRGDVEGYVVEARVLPGGFQTLATLDASAVRFTYAVSPGFAELIDMEFRVSALPAGKGSRASNVAAIHRGLRSPFWLCAVSSCKAVNGAIALELTNRSQLADSLLLERSVTLPSPGGQTRTSLRLPPDTKTFLDADGGAAWVDGAAIEYRLTAVKGAERSPTFSRSLGTAPPLAARILGVATAAGALQVTFENESRSATSFDLNRFDAGTFGQTVVHAPAPATGASAVLTDPSAPSVSTVYAVRARIDDPNGVETSNAFLIWPTPPTDLAVSVTQLSFGTEVVRMNGGGFATAAVAHGGLIAVVATNGADVEDLVGWLDRPGLALDDQSRPHAVYGVGGPAPASLFHAWHDGVIWQVEPLGSITAQSSISFDVGPDGTVHGAWLTTATQVTVARRSTQGWSFETVDIPAAAAGVAPRVQGDAAGESHLLFAHASALTYMRRVNGAWAAEAVPTTRLPSAFIASARGISLAGNENGSAWLIERTASGWGSVETLATIGFSDEVRAARSRDGARIAIATPGAAGAGRLFLRDAAGTVQRSWTSALAASFDVAVSSSVGFDASGKAWVLTWRGDSDLATLYEEP